MWEELVSAGLDPKEAKFYLAVLGMDRPTVAEAAERAGVSGTNAYDIANRLVRHGRRGITGVGPRGQPSGGGRCARPARVVAGRLRVRGCPGRWRWAARGCAVRAPRAGGDWS